MNTFIYIGEGYTKRGFGNYVKITVVETKENEPTKSWRNKLNNVILRTGKLFAGVTADCQAMRKIEEIKKDYPGVKMASSYNNWMLV